MRRLRSGHEMLEWCRKEVEVATGLNRQLSDLNHDMASAVKVGNVLTQEVYLCVQAYVRGASGIQDLRS